MSLAPAPAAGQTLTTAAETWQPLRTSDGQPDMHGFWGMQAGTPPFMQNIEEGAEAQHTVIAANQFRSGTAIVDPPDGKVPYQPWAMAKRNERPHDR